MIPPFSFKPAARSGGRPRFFRLAPAGALALAVACLPAALFGARSESVNHQSFTEFAKGELKNVSLHRDGRLSLAPGATEVARLVEAVIWSAAAGPDGAIYLGAGNEGNIYRLSPEGELKELFGTGEVLTRAMTFDHEGRLYVGSSPDGKVYRFTPGETEPEVFFDPRETYIWALLFDEEGDLFVATGDEGRIYRIPAGSEAGATGEIYFDGDESHISALAWDEEGRLLAGTSPNGYVYRIKGKDESFVLFNSPDEEIRKVLPGEDGETFVATYSSGSGRTGGGSIAQAVAALSNSDNSNGGSSSNSGSGSGSGRPSTLYRVDADGFHEPFWGLSNVSIESLLKLDDGPLLIGTGDDARIFSLTGFQSWKLRQTLPTGSKVSEMLHVPGTTDVLAFSSNPARIYRLDFGLSGEGTFLSKIHDAKQVVRWGRIYTEAGGSDGVQTFVRSGNTEKANQTWTNWRPVDTEGNGSGLTAPGRYFQYRLDFADPDAEVRRMRFFYRRANAAPIIRDLRVVTADLQLEQFEAPPQQPSVDLEQLMRDARPRGPESRQQIRALDRPGVVTVLWKARDPNDDDLVYRVKLREAGSDTWDTIADKVRQSFYSFNGNGLRDGEYQVKVVASDRLSNHPGEAREGKRVSESFLIDNAAPEIHVEDVTVSRGDAVIRFRATDETSILARADYVLNGEAPVRIFPEDGLFDAREDTFQVELKGLSSGRHTLRLQVEDEAGNSRIHQMPVEVE